jgi:hypothetical protein
VAGIVGVECGVGPTDKGNEMKLTKNEATGTLSIEVSGVEAERLSAALSLTQTFVQIAKKLPLTSLLNDEEAKGLLAGMAVLGGAHDGMEMLARKTDGSLVRTTIETLLEHGKLGIALMDFATEAELAGARAE